MTVQDDLHRLGQLDGIYLGWSVQNTSAGAPGAPVTIWYKGRLQQANDGNWIFRSISADGTVVGFQLGPPQIGPRMRTRLPGLQLQFRLA
jgi:hypothetical protein